MSFNASPHITNNLHTTSTLRMGTFYVFAGGTNEDDMGKSLAKWFEENSKSKINCNEYSCIGVCKKGALVGVMVYVNYTVHNMDIHVHIPNCLSRATIKEMFSYPFIRVKVTRLTANVSEKNTKVIKILVKLGFKYEAELSRYRSDGSNQCIYVAYKKDIEKWVN